MPEGSSARRPLLGFQTRFSSSPCLPSVTSVSQSLPLTVTGLGPPTWPPVTLITFLKLYLQMRPQVRRWGWDCNRWILTEHNSARTAQGQRACDHGQRSSEAAGPGRPCLQAQRTRNNGNQKDRTFRSPFGPSLGSWFSRSEGRGAGGQSVGVGGGAGGT